MTKIAFSKAKKIAMKFFGSEMTPPPFRKFSGNSSVLVCTGFPYVERWSTGHSSQKLCHHESSAVVFVSCYEKKLWHINSLFMSNFSSISEALLSFLIYMQLLHLFLEKNYIYGVFVVDLKHIS